MTAPIESQLDDEQLNQYEALIRELADQSVSVARVRQLHETIGEPWSSMVLSSAQWQRKANEKLGEGLWWLTDRALQQSTAWQVAKQKASWFGEGPVWDLCSGIGGDTIHLSQSDQSQLDPSTRRSVTAVDSDPDICEMLHRNLANHGADQNCEIVHATVDSVRNQITQDSWIHIDPDRRTGSAANQNASGQNASGQNAGHQSGGDSRTTSPEFYSPDWSTTMQIVSQSRGGLIKLAPVAQLPSIPDRPSHRLWISLCGNVREQSLMIGDLVDRFAQKFNVSCNTSTHSALVIQRDESLGIFTGESDTAITTTAKPMEIMVDPDAAIRGSGLTAAFAQRFGLSCIGSASGYLTGPVPTDTSLETLAICEEVIWSGSCDDRKLRRELRSRDLYPKRIKTRGVQHDPNKMEKKLRDCGQQPITLWIGRSGKGRYAAFTK